MLKIIDTAFCRGTAIESDPWLPLKVSWLPIASRQPLYLRLSGREGGELEFKVDPITGALSQFILMLPPDEVVEVPEVHLLGNDADLLVPITDRSMWKDHNPGSIAIAVTPITIVRGENGMTVNVSDVPSLNVVRADKVEIGYGMNGTLVSVSVLFDTKMA